MVAVGVRGVGLRAEAGIAGRRWHHGVEVGDDPNAESRAARMAKAEDQRARRFLWWCGRRKSQCRWWRRRFGTLRGATGGSARGHCGERQGAKPMALVQ
jgi:hypothetical protein